MNFTFWWAETKEIIYAYGHTTFLNIWILLSLKKACGSASFFPSLILSFIGNVYRDLYSRASLVPLPRCDLPGVSNALGVQGVLPPLTG